MAASKRELPPLMYIVNRDAPGDTEKITPQGNPPRLSGEIKAAYNRLKIPGMSHQVKQFSNTEDHKTSPIEFEFYGDTPKERDDIDRQFAIWQSWMLPVPADNIRGGSPPRLLFYWPNVMQMQVVITDFKYEIAELTVDGDISWLKITCSFEQISDKRILPADVRAVGLRQS